MGITRLSTGIDQLDSLILGGLPEGSTVCYSGPSGTGKTSAGINFICNGLKRDEACLIVTTWSTIESFHQFAKLTNRSLEKVTFVDAANWRVKRFNPKEESPSDYEVSSTTDLNSLLNLIIKACKEHEISRIFFDSPSNLLIYNTPGPEQVYRFFELMTSYTRTQNITLVYTLEEGVHLDREIATLKYLSDGVVRFKQNGSEFKRQILPQYLVYTDVNASWVDLDLT